MIGFILRFPSIPEELKKQYPSLEADQPIYCVVFPDSQVYLHEPIVDTFGCMQDLSDRLPGANIENAKDFQICYPDVTVINEKSA